jgi:hypothetical protein
MGRHDKAGGSPVKTQSRKKLGSRNTAKAARRRKSSTADAADRIAVLTLERDEALDRQRATYEVLKVISSSPGEPEPVFEAMLESALRICEAEFGMLMQYNSGEGSFDTRVMVGAPPALVDALLNQSFTPPPGNPLDRMLRTKKRCMSSTRRRKRPNRSLHNWLARGHTSACLCLRRTKSLAPSPSTARRFDHLPTSRSN